MITKKLFGYGLLAVILAIAALALISCGDAEGGGGDDDKDITYTAVETGGTTKSTDSTGIIFTFSASVDSLGLTAADITVGGVASKGVNATLNGTGTTRTLSPIVVSAEGNATVKITKSGIEAATKNAVAVYKAVAACDCMGAELLCTCEEGECDCPTCDPLPDGMLIIVNVTATNREYNGTNIVTLTGGQLVGVAVGDSVNFNLGGTVAIGSGTGTMDDKNAGNNKKVTTAINLIGADSNKYQLIQPTVTVNIAPKPITITGVSATDRIYDATTAVALTGGTLESSAIVSSDTVTFTLGNGTMANKNVGDNKAITTAITLTGADAGNYALTQPSGITVSISKKTITANVSATDREYNDLLAVALTGTLEGVESGDTVNSGGEGDMADINPGNGKTVTITSFTLSGADADNYNLTTPTASGTVNINPGTGTAADPWRVVTEADLRKVATETTGWTLAAHYKLTATKGIDLTDKTAWAMIHIVETNPPQWGSFTGSFDGNGYTITGLSCDNTGFLNPSASGMFYEIGTTGVVKNLKLINVTIKGNGDAGVGGVAAWNKGTVENCFVSGSVTGIASENNFVAAGGVVASNDGTVQNCYSACTVNAMLVGGVVASSTGTVQNCYSTGSVSGGSTAGGVVGSAMNGSAKVQKNVALNTSITTEGLSIGRIAGTIGSNTTPPAPPTLTNNHARSDMSGSWNAKGLTARDGADVTSATYSTQAFWQTTLGWDFTTIWEWDTTTNLPKLR
jgi:hypothetical protein